MIEKPRILVANKMDRPEAKKNLTRFKKELKLRPMEVSAETGEGVPELMEKVSKQIGKIKEKG